MTNVKIHLDKNLLFAPEVFRQVTSSYAGIARDIIIWAAYDHPATGRCHLPVGEFCRLFNYNRQYLLKKLTDKKLAQLKKAGIHEVKNVIEYVLYKLSCTTILFEKGYFHVNPDKSEERVTRFKGTQPLIGKLQFVHSRKGNLYSFDVQGYFYRACHSRYETFNLDDYLRLVTEQGEGKQQQAWDSGRQLFLRMVWKRHNFTSTSSAFKDGQDDYLDYKRISGIGPNNAEKKIAYELRTMLDKVNLLGNVGLMAQLDYQEVYGQQPYKLLFKRVKPEAAEEVAEKAE